MVSRRAVVGGVGALALAGLGYRAWDRGVFTSGEGPAYAPWGEWRGQDADGAQRPLHAAILAANPHDTQPWLFAASDNSITVFADRARNLGAFDPFRREMHLGLGCAVENIVRAAGVYGIAAYVAPVEGLLTLSPGPEPVAVAHIRLDAAAPARDPLFEAIPNRHTNRGRYRRDQAIPHELLHRFVDLVTSDSVRLVFVEDRAARDEFGALMVEATQRIIDDPEMAADSAHWFRTGAREIAWHRDGITMDAAGLPPLTVAAAKIMPDQDAKTADSYWLSMTRDTHAATAPLFGMILVKDRLHMLTAIEAGRAWQRLHLAATVEGIAAQPMNQPVEMVDRNAMLSGADSFAPALAKFSGNPGWEPTFTFRMGYADHPAPPSPRRPLSDVLRS
jgi:nitroreductase